MRTWSGVAMLVVLGGCPGRPGGDSGDATGSSSTTGGSSTDPSAEGPATSASTSASTSEATTTAGPADTTADSTAGSTGESNCVMGTFRGEYFSGFEWTYLEICDGPVPWTEAGDLYACDQRWVVIEGTLCGPGSYGHLGGYDYLLTGTVVEGPCAEGSCEGELMGCGTVEEICGGTAECSWIDQDCPEGEKCVPASRANVPPWTSTECVPTVPGAVGPGEACVVGPPDDCQPGLYCWNQDPFAPDGTCVELCEPTTAPCPGPRQCVDCEGDIGQAGGADLGMCLPADCGGIPCSC